MRRKRQKDIGEVRQETPGVDISSLVDVSFLLLIYFLVASTIVKKEQDLGMQLPSGSPSLEIPQAPLPVVLHQDGSVVLNPGKDYEEQIAAAGVGSSLDPLSARLRLIKATLGEQAAVELKVSESVDYQRFIEIINCMAGEGVIALGLADL